MDQELCVLAYAQGGAFSAAQAIAVGWTPGRIRTELRAGHWLRAQRGIFVDREVSELCRRTPQAGHALQTAAALLGSHGRRWAVGLSAACLLGLETMGRLPERPALGETHLDESDGVRWKGSRSRRSRHLVSSTPADQLVVIGRLRTTGPARTAIDVARGSPGTPGVVAMDSAARQFGLAEQDLRGVASAQARWPYARSVGAALDRMDERTESVLETLGRLALPAEWPPASSQVWVGEEAPEYRVDFLVPGLWVAGEADGRLKYVSPEVLWEEKRRQDRIEELGWTFLRFDRRDATAGRARLTERFRAAARRARPGAGRVFPDPEWWLRQRATSQARARQHAPWWLPSMP